MKTILMLVPLWRRPEIVALFIRNIERTIPDYIQLMPMFILSPEDPDYVRLRKLTEGYRVCAASNNPLGTKKNNGLLEALQYEWDYLMDMGSDDIYTRTLWDLYEDYFLTGSKYFGIKNMYVLDIIENRALFVEGYHLNHFDQVTAIGPGRCVRRDIVEQCFPLWPDKPFGMDGGSDEKIVRAGYYCHLIDNGRTPTVLDVKSYCNLNPFMFMDEGEEVDASWVREQFNIEGLSIQDTFTRDGFKTAVYKHAKDNDLTIERSFNDVNECHRKLTGEVRYKNYNSFKNSI
jgi:hypothetical protein